MECRALQDGSARLHICNAGLCGIINLSCSIGG